QLPSSTNLHIFRTHPQVILHTHEPNSLTVGHNILLPSRTRLDQSDPFQLDTTEVGRSLTSQMPVNPRTTQEDMTSTKRLSLRDYGHDNLLEFQCNYCTTDRECLKLER